MPASALDLDDPNVHFALLFEVYTKEPSGLATSRSPASFIAALITDIDREESSSSRRPVHSTEEISFIQASPEFIGYVAALLTTFGFVPQLIKIHRTRSVSDVSFPMLLQYSLGCLLWLAYGLQIKNAILIGANGISLGIFVTAIALYIRFRPRSQVHAGLATATEEPA